MAEKKKRKGRRAYLNDFHVGLNGEYTYTGPIYRYEGELPYRQALTRLRVLTAAMCLAMIGAGVVPAPSMVGFGNFYVVPFFMIELVGVALSAWSAYRLISGGEDLRAYVYEATVNKLPQRLEMTFFFAAACVAVNIVYICLNGFGGKVILSLLLIVLHVGVGAVAQILRRTLALLRWNTGREEGELPEPEE